MRNSIQDFSLANPIYVGATVTAWTVAAGVKTATKATLYAGATGTATLTNPQSLDSDGKFQQPVYIDDPVIMTVSGLSIADHDTGIVQSVLAAGQLSSVYEDLAAANGVLLVGNAADKRDLASTASGKGAALVGFRQRGTAAVETTVDDRELQTVHLWDYLTAAQKIDVSTRAATIDVLPAINALMAEFTEVGVGDLAASPVIGIIELPRGKMLIAGTLNITATVTFRGHGRGMEAGNWATELVFPSDTRGVRIFKSKGTPFQNGGDGSIFEGVLLQGGGGTAVTTAHGFDMEGRATLRDSAVQGFAGNGVNINADSVSNTNANCWRVDTVALLENGGHGMYVEGNDANAGSANLISAARNGGWGIWDSSFLGNTYVACHTANNTLGAYKSDNGNARNLFLNCYSEPGQPPSEITSPAMAISGHHGAGFDDTIADSAPWPRSLQGQLSVQKGVESRGLSTADGRTLISRIGGNALNGDLLYFNDTIDAPSTWRLKSVNKGLAFDYGNTGSNQVFGISGPNTIYTFGRAAPVPYIMYGTRFAIGSTTNGRIHDTLPAAPTTGDHARGEIAWNSTPIAGGFAGWICTTAGTPGTWKTFGVISA